MKENQKNQANVVVSAFQGAAWAVAGFFLGLTALAFVFGFVYKLTFAVSLFWNRLAPETLSVVSPPLWGTFGVVVVVTLAGVLTWFAKDSARRRRLRTQNVFENTA